MSSKKIFQEVFNKAPNLQKITRCLISVSHKDGIIDLAKFLANNNIEIISTGGTYRLLKENNIPVIEINKFTNFPEMMDGRLKTLHPKVHGGLLALPNNQNHLQAMLENEILSIDLLIVNLYPFVETVAKSNDVNEIIENIDIGGPAMVRSAAKNFFYKTVITRNADYEKLITELTNNNFSTTLDLRFYLANTAFNEIAKYDNAIASWFQGQNLLNQNLSNNVDIQENSQEDDVKFPQIINIEGKILQNLRYGESSHQKATIYSLKNYQSAISSIKHLQGKELSYSNFNDIDAAYNLIFEFSLPAVAIIKHNNPCGVAVAISPLIAYQKALLSDKKSAFGGVVIINRQIDNELALLLSQMFFEVIIAPSFSNEALTIFLQKKNLRIVTIDFNLAQKYAFKSLSGAFLLQEIDNFNLQIKDLQQVTENLVDNADLEQLVFAMKVATHLKSNAVSVVSNMQTIGLGVGQTNRVDACKIACQNAINLVNSSDYQNFYNSGSNINNLPINNKLFLASDAFFPFADNIEIAAQFGISAIIATKGSIRDQEVIEMAKQKNIALYFVENRHFKH